jgi:hypothetical protein
MLNFTLRIKNNRVTKFALVQGFPKQLLLFGFFVMFFVATPLLSLG